jgi:hypothetical protein
MYYEVIKESFSCCFSKLILGWDGLGISSVVIRDDQNMLVSSFGFLPTVLQALHDDMGHPGKDRTLSLLRNRFYWPGMYKDTESWIEQCGRCLRRKTPTNQNIVNQFHSVVFSYHWIMACFLLVWFLIGL